MNWVNIKSSYYYYFVISVGPTALIQFLIWQRGNVDLPHLTNRLMRAVQHSLCDVMMEYRILTAPMGVVSKDCIQGLTPFASPFKGVESKFSNQGSQGLVAQGTFYRQLWGNQLQFMLQDHFGSIWVIFMSYNPTNNMWKFKCEWTLFLEIAWNWLPVNCLVWHDP